MNYDPLSEKNKSLLLELSRRPENRECADCTSRVVKWACFNHGIFVCIKCSGIHRDMGREISKVKSLTLDKWTTEELSGMCGNALANAEYLFNLPSDMTKPDENDDRARRHWIENKYKKQLWRRRPDQSPAQPQQQQPQPQQQQFVPPTQPHPSQSASLQLQPTPVIPMQQQPTSLQMMSQQLGAPSPSPSQHQLCLQILQLQQDILQMQGAFM
ncbi:putative GTPase activating protein for Arf [Giardia muris]|uniref:Putative GTPase activating protein for Arf n=1 Tax=Giardia muris TaxID=5742 RepID=A0A4Z1SQC4_GIAMU|nr:putative GTPase activating protein for Arf [Giardia muris]|eukprot:TNJ28016.1 putative GTPase activating protein for Arf [Giardia muris]